MNRQEIKVAIAALGIIGLAALTLSLRKNQLGQPGLLLESQVLTNENGIKVADQRVALPTGIPGYTDELLPITAREIEVLPKDTTFGRRLYKSTEDKLPFQVSAILMGSDRTSLHKPYYCITGQGWRIDKYDVTTIPMARPEPYELRAQLLTTTGEHRTSDLAATPVRGLFMYWYVSDTQLAATHKEQMWLLARDLVTQGTLKRWSYITMFSICAPGQEEILLERMKRLASEMVPRFQIPPGPVPTKTALLDRATAFTLKNFNP
jgi:hypothetical protein